MSEKDKAELLDLIALQKDELIHLRETVAAQNEHLGMLSERINSESQQRKSARSKHSGSQK